MAVSTPSLDVVSRPHWPVEPFDPARAYLHYGAVADELVLYFTDEPVRSFSDLIDAPEGDDTAVLVGLTADDEETNDVIGIHVYPLLAGAAEARPAWRALAEPAPPAEVVARFVAEVKELFDRFWTPAPPIEEQLARRRAEPLAGGGA